MLPAPRNYYVGSVLVGDIERKIYLIRGRKVMLDEDLAGVYGIATKRLNEQVRRNRRRFPADFMFELSEEEFDILRSQNATSKRRGGRRYLPFAFTEHGAVMLSSVLNTTTAVEASIAIARAFVRFRQIFLGNKALAYKLRELELRVKTHDVRIRSIFKAMRELMEPPAEKIKRIGFRP